MNTLKSLAENIIIKSGLSPELKCGSVIITIMLISILVNVIRVIQECDKKQLCGLNQDQQIKTCQSSIKNLSIKRGWYTKMRLKKILRQHMPIVDYKAYGNVLCEKILDSGETITTDQVYSLITEANNV